MHIKEYCQKHGMTPTELASRSKVSFKHLTQVANLKCGCSFRVASLINQATNGEVTVEELMIPQKYAPNVKPSCSGVAWISKKKEIVSKSVGENG